ncbi:MAG: SDR family oxidoreductase [Acidimicrobiales bacterium]|nr:SDR family oxidoreductase [Acidimicrobiales bacterium]
MTELPLAGRGALVTGGGSGIGLAVARRLVADGAAVTIGGRSEERLRVAAEQLGASAPPGIPVGWVVVDVADEEQVRSAVAAAAEPAGGLHLAALAAGTGTLGPLVVTPVDAWRAVLETNLTGAFLCIKHAAPAMVRAGGGAIVAVSSIAGPLTHRYMGAYAVSKTGLESLVRNAADELGRAGVRVNAVRPGLVPTELSAALAGDEAIRADYLAQMPLARLGTPDDVANGVRYLLGPESAWVTGQCLAIDGGHTLRRGPDLEAVARLLFGDDAVEGRGAP